MTPGGFVLHHARGLLLGCGLLVAAGGVAWMSLPTGLYPELSFPRIAVAATLPDATAELVRTNLTRPLEEALLPVLGVRRVRSRTIRGATEVSAWFDANQDMVVALQLVQARLAEIRPELPAAAQITAERVTPTSFPVFTVNVDGPLSVEKLRDIALFQLRPALSRVPGVGPVTVTAGAARELSVEVDPLRAEAAGLDAETVARRVADAVRIETVGRLDRAHQRAALVVRGAGITALGELVVGGDATHPVRLAQVATIREGGSDPHLAVASPRGPAVVLSIARRPGGDVVALDHALFAEIARLAREVPPGVRLEPVYRQAPLVEAAAASVRDAIIIGTLLSSVIVAFFLARGRRLRATALAALTIPASLAGACLALALRHDSLNVMSLGGMAIAVGLVIDDAVVMLEAIDAELDTGIPPRAAVERAVGRLLGPILSTTLTTVVVFAPLGAISGVVGTFFGSLALSLSAAVLVSLGLALFVLPPLAARWPSHEPDGGESRIGAAYERALRWTLARRKRALAGAAAFVVAIAIAAFWLVPTGFLPELDEGGYVIDYFTPIGTALPDADGLGQKIDAVLKADPEVATFTRRLGAELGPPRATEASRGDIMVRLKRGHAPIDDVMEHQRAELAAAVPGVRVELIQLLSDMLGDLEGSPEPIELKLFGEDLDELRRSAASVAAAIADVRGVVDLFNGQLGCSPERVLTVDEAAAGRLGLSAADVAGQLGAGLLGSSSATLPDRDRLLPVRVRWPDATRFSGSVLDTARLRTPAGRVVPLSSVARWQDGCGPGELLRENLQQMVLVTARLEGRDLGGAMTDIEARLKKLSLPRAVRLEIGGQRASQLESFRALAAAIGAALALVLLVCVFQLRSLGASLAILGAIPAALAGGLLALIITRAPLNVSSLLGMLLLVGLVVKNGILLAEHARRLLDDGASREDAWVLGARRRLRPILMTTLATLLGLLPLAFGIGAGSELHRALAIAVVGGLAISTLATLFVVPALALGRR
jgi:multidrug efflux pump subunit AcrB